MEADKYIMIIKYLSDNSHKLTPLVLAVSVLVAYLSRYRLVFKIKLFQFFLLKSFA